MKKQGIAYFSLLLAACATQSHSPLTILVTPSGYIVDGETLTSRAELTDTIIKHKAKIVDVKLDKQASYSKALWEKTEEAIEAVRDAGAKLPIVGNYSE